MEKSINVLYDHKIFELQTHGGISNYFVNIIKNFPPDISCSIGAFFSNNVYLNEIGIDSLNTFLKKQYPHIWNLFGEKKTEFLVKLYFHIKNGTLRLSKNQISINQSNTIHLLKKQSFDVFHPTFYDDFFLPYIGKKPFVLTIHDMIPEIYPQLYNDNQRELKAKLIPLASHIITVSKKTKSDLLRFFDVPDKKISVIYHGAQEDAYIPSIDPIIDGKYILFVGSRQNYKMFNEWLYSCLPVLSKYSEIKIVCTGTPFSGDEVSLFRKLKIEKRMFHFFAKTYQEMMDLYHFSQVFVFPSEYEGFGIPILESFKARCPLILTKDSCFPEIAGDAATYITKGRNGFDFFEQFEKIYRQTTEERETLLQNQDNQLSFYSWNKAAQQIADIYRSLV